MSASERPIERWLRALARHRRQRAADAPVALHPATRRLLQGEVARHYRAGRQPAAASRTGRARAGLSQLWALPGAVLTALRRQTVGSLLGVLLVLGIVAVVAAMLLPAFPKAKSRASYISGLNNLKQIGIAAQIYAQENDGRLPMSFEQMKNELGSERVTIEPESGLPFVYLGNGLPLEALQSNSVLAHSPIELKGRRAVLFADGRVEQVNRTRFEELTQRGLVLLAAETHRSHPAQAELAAAKSRAEPAREMFSTVPAPQPKSFGTMIAGQAGQSPPTAASQAASAVVAARDAATAEAIKAPTTSSPSVSAPPALAGQVAAVPTQIAESVSAGVQPGKMLFSNAAPAPADLPVLRNFNVQSVANQLRIVDADGSVYEGELVAAESGPVGIASADTAGPSRRAARMATEPRRTEPPSATSAPALAFEVQGTNRTLQQQVRFSGNLLPPPGQTASEWVQNFQNLKPASAQPPGPQPAMPPWNAIIQGRARLEQGQEIEIRAVPVPP